MGEECLCRLSWPKSIIEGFFIGVWPRWHPEVYRPKCLLYEGTNQPNLSMRQTSRDYEAIQRVEVGERKQQTPSKKKQHMKNC